MKTVYCQEIETHCDMAIYEKERRDDRPDRCMNFKCPVNSYDSIIFIYCRREIFRELDDGGPKT